MSKYHTCSVIVVLSMMWANPIWAKMYEPPASFIEEMKSLELVQQKMMPAVDVEELRREDYKREADPMEPVPFRFAADIDVNLTLENSGTWNDLPRGGRIWRLQIKSTGAQSLNLGFTEFNLPNGAKLWIYNPAGDQVEGPYTQTHRTRQGQLWTPIILGEEIIVELFLPPKANTQPKLTIGKVNHGYRDFGGSSGILMASANEKACRIDVICPEGDLYRDEIRSIATYTILGTSSCTGNLLNNTRGDFTPNFLTAWHCFNNIANKTNMEFPELTETMTFYWNYESLNCGDLGRGKKKNGDTQIGATYRATWRWGTGTDFLLVELKSQPDSAFNVFYSGWDATGSTPSSTVTIHHQKAQVKVISFENDPVTPTKWGSDTQDPDGKYWRVEDYDVGTTWKGSSGSCLRHSSNGLCVGQLSVGSANCVDDLPNDLPDWYGRLNVSWEGNGTPDTRLRDWLNPTHDGTKKVDGANPSWPYEYTVRLVCGTQSVPDPFTPVSRLIPGRYTTTINVHNPLNKQVRFNKKLALAYSAATFPVFIFLQSPGPIFPIAEDVLDWDQALATGCVDIGKKLVNDFPFSLQNSYYEGFLVIQSDDQLDVMAVYTSEGLAKDSRSMDVKRIEPTCPVRTAELGERTLFFVPPQVRGDREYAGNGPCVVFGLAVGIDDDGKTLAAKYRMHAYECSDDFDKPTGDRTAALGDEQVVLKTANRDRILGHSLNTNMTFQYIDTNTEDDLVSFAEPNPVKELRFVGDTDGNEAGTKTGVFITLRTMKVEMAMCKPGSK